MLWKLVDETGIAKFRSWQQTLQKVEPTRTQNVHLM